MNEIQAQECYDAVGILLKHKDILSEGHLGVNGLTEFRNKIKKFLPCEHENYAILEEIYSSNNSEVEIRIRCDNCDHLGVKAYMNTGSIGWDS